MSAAGIPFEVVPGVTAAVAAASHAGIALRTATMRRPWPWSPVISAATQENRPDLDYDALARFPGTLVFYMGISTARQWSTALVRGGRSSDTPVAVVRRATWPDQQVFRCTLGSLADMIERGPCAPRR